LGSRFCTRQFADFLGHASAFEAAGPRVGLRWDAPDETAYPATFVIDRGGAVRFAQVSLGHDGRALATDVLKALDRIPR
jgi:hypothetical protein